MLRRRHQAIYVQTKKENEWSAEWVDEFSDEVGQQLAEQAFENLDKDEDGVLSFQEFKEFAMSEPTAVAQLYGLSREVRVVEAQEGWETGDEMRVLILIGRSS